MTENRRAARGHGFSVTETLMVAAFVGTAAWVVGSSSQAKQPPGRGAALAIEVAGSTDEEKGPDRPYAITVQPRWPQVTLPGGAPPASLDFKHDYAFDRDWHTRHATYWSQALERFKGKPEISYLEVGLFEGASFFWMLEKILTHPTARATGVDPFFGIYSDIRNYGNTFFDNLTLSGEEARTTIVRDISQTAMRRMSVESYDIIYIDGSHDARDVLEDAVLAWRLLKDGGVLIFDDYELWWDRPAAQRPQFAIDVFYTFFKNEFAVTHFGYQVMLTKTTGA